jgi:ADP-ribosylglycohydrolase
MADSHEPSDEPSEALHANAAARAFPAGCLPGGSKSDDPAAVAAWQAALSNGDKRAQSAAAVIADSVHYFICGAKLKSESDVRAFVKREFEVANRFDPRFAESWDDVAPDLDYINPAEDLPYSLVNVESNLNELVPTAVGIFLVFRHDLEEAICAAARSGGDTDTVAALVGALSGAYHGADKIPRRWLDGLTNKPQLEKVAEGLAKLW